jgi:integrase
MSVKGTRGEFKGYRLRNRNGRYSVEIRLKEGNKHKTLPLGISKAEATRLANLEYEQVARRTDPIYQQKQLDKISLAELIDLYLKDGRESNTGKIKGIFKIKLTFEHEAEILERFKRDNKQLVSKKLGQLTSDDFQDYIDKRQQQGIKDSTILRQLNPIFFILGRYARIVHKIPMPEIRKSMVLPEEHNEPGVALTVEQVAQLKRAVWDHCTGDIVQLQMRLIIDLALDTGVRLGGLLKIQWKHIDRKKYQYFQPWDKKSPDRDLPLKYEMAKKLERWKDRIPEACNNPDGYVFFTTKGKNIYSKLDNDNFSEYFSEFCDLAGLPDVTFHDLRHTSRTWMVNAGLLGYEWAYMHGVLKDRYLHEYILGIRAKWDPEGIKLIGQDAETKPSVVARSIKKFRDAEDAGREYSALNRGKPVKIVIPEGY